MSKSSNTKTQTQSAEQIAELARLRNEKEVAEALAKTDVSQMYEQYKKDDAQCKNDTERKAVAEAYQKSLSPEVPNLEFAESAPISDEEIEMSQFWAELKAKLPSGKRAITALLVSVAASTTAIYGVNLVCAYAVAGVLALSGSALLAMIISALGWIISALAAFAVGRRVFAAIITGDYGVTIPASINPMNWFGSKEITVAPTPSAA